MPKGRRGYLRVTFEVAPELYEQLVQLAETNDRSLSAEVRRVVTAHVRASVKAAEINQELVA